ncbi:MAG TPA: kelch repeat-containing protein, partial [Minicystis sp.]|nr:kelch repeat-containing protein [Minicystis sp.]
MPNISLFDARTAAAAAMVSGLALGFAACADAIHLDPGASGGGGAGGATSSTGHASGGGAPVACTSNPDCTYPTNVCDPGGHVCVQCIETTDCADRPGTVCSKGKCACATKGESFCAADASGGARCVDLETSQADCGSCGHACFGACSGGACSDAWEPTSLDGAPAARAFHTAVWTGKVMVVWGGQDDAGNPLGDGARYDPATRMWKPVDPVGAPVPRAHHTALWNGSKMIVFGGASGAKELGDGAVFDPAANAWSPMTLTGAPGARQLHTAVWAGSRMVVWGGRANSTELGDGGRYDPASDAWTPVSGSGAPTARRQHAAAASGSKMVVWGGYGDDGTGTTTYLGNGAVYDANLDSWSLLTGSGAPSARFQHTAVEDNGKVFIYGGNAGGATAFGDGGVYDVAGDSWSPLNGMAPPPRDQHTAVVVGTGASTAMLVWGGQTTGNVSVAD